MEYGPESGYTDGKVLDGGATGYNVRTYKCKYSIATNQLISRDFEAFSSYMTKNRVVVKIVEPESPGGSEGEGTGGGSGEGSGEGSGGGSGGGSGEGSGGGSGEGSGGGSGEGSGGGSDEGSE